MSIERRQAVLRLLALVGFEAAAVVGIHVVGRSPYVGVTWSDLGGWLAVTPVDQVVISLVWVAAAALAWWTLASTLLYVVTRTSGLRAGTRLAERLAPSAVRRAVDRAVAATLVGTALLGPAAPALAAERSPVATVQVAAVSEYEPQPAGSEAPPVSAPVPQRTAPAPVEQRARDRDERAGGGDGAGEDADTQDKQRTRSKGKGGGEPGDGAGPGGKGGAKRSAAGDGEAGGGEAEAAAEAANRAAVAAALGSEAPDSADASEPAASEPAEEPVDDEADTPRGEEQAPDVDGDRARARRAGEPRPGSRYTVQVGDHLWRIATEVVAAEGDGAAGRAAVAAYWADLVRAATPGLRSGDPNLIYPGERITLPPLASQTQERR